jgi:inosine-uridine nucleoside N-ribohydrolase
MIPIILDTDIGTDVDDALALTLAVRSPEIDILTITLSTTPGTFGGVRAASA